MNFVICVGAYTGVVGHWTGWVIFCFFNIYKKKIQKRHIGERKKEIFAQNKAWVAMMGVSCDDVLYV